MKKYASILILLGALSCSVVEEVGSPIITDSKITIGVNTESDSQTKTSLDGNAVIWSENDVIKLYTAEGGNGDFTLVSGAGTNSAKFTGTLSSSGTYYAVYPASAANGFDKSTKELMFTIPAVQTYSAAGFADGFNPMVAYGSDKDNLSFKNPCGILRLVIKGTETITSISLSSAGGEYICGKAGVMMVYGSEGPSIGIVEGLDTVTLECPEGVKLNEDGVNFNIIVPTDAFFFGFNVSIYDKSGSAMKLSAPMSDANVMKRSSIKTMPAITYKANFSPFSDITIPGIYDLSAPEIPALARYSLDSFRQCNSTSGTNSLEMQLIDWKGLQLVTVKASANSLVEGATCTMTVHTRSFSGLTDGTSSATLEKVTGTLLYFRDSANNIGYVMPK